MGYLRLGFVLLILTIGHAEDISKNGAPLWTSAPRGQYLKYDGKTKKELAASANPIRLPYHFREPTAAANEASLLSGVCSFPSGPPDAPPFWFDFQGNRLAGKFKNTMPSEYFVSPVRPASGLRIQAAFGGAAHGSGVLYETAYYHQQPCDAGGLEFGFYRNVVAGQTVFYISNNSNCGIQPNGYCHVSDSFSSAYMNEDNDPGQAVTTNVNGWEIKNLKVGSRAAQLSRLIYSAFVTPDQSTPRGFRFQVDVLDPATSRQATCDAVDTHGAVLVAAKPCGFAVRPGQWYPIDQLAKTGASGYVTVGVQRQGSPEVTSVVDFWVERVSVPK